MEAKDGGNSSSLGKQPQDMGSSKAKMSHTVCPLVGLYAKKHPTNPEPPSETQKRVASGSTQDRIEAKTYGNPDIDLRHLDRQESDDGLSLLKPLSMKAIVYHVGPGPSKFEHRACSFVASQLADDKSKHLRPTSEFDPRKVTFGKLPKLFQELFPDSHRYNPSTDRFGWYNEQNPKKGDRFNFIKEDSSLQNAVALAYRKILKKDTSPMLQIFCSLLKRPEFITNSL